MPTTTMPITMPTIEQTQEREGTLEAGTRVEVRSRFDASWSHGFELVEESKTGYRVRRLSDRMILPVEFSFDDVRKERRRQGLWWY